MKTNLNYTLITGASMGLGREFATVCAKAGMNLILVSLPGEKLRLTAEYLANRYKINTVYFETDLSCKESILRLCEKVTNHYSVNMIINNAGFGGSRLFESTPLDYLDRMIQLNVRAVSLLTRLMMKELLQHPRAWIMNISSLAAFSPMPFKTIYPASKAFVYYFSRGLAEELRDTHVRVCVVHPGPMMTNDEVCSRIKKQGFPARLCMISAERIASLSISQMFKGKKVIIPGFLNKVNYYLLQWVPVSIRLPLLSRIMRRELKTATCNIPEVVSKTSFRRKHTAPLSIEV